MQLFGQEKSLILGISDSIKWPVSTKLAENTNFLYLSKTL